MAEELNLAEIKTNIDSVLTNEVAERHSLFQLQCFVLAKEPTIQAKLWQCLRELKSRKLSLDAIELEIEEQSDKLELLDLELEQELKDAETGDPKSRTGKMRALKMRSIERKRKAHLSHLTELKCKQKNISEEALFFTSAFDQLSRREKLKPWDDADVQKEYWNEKLRIEVNTRLLLRQLPDVDLLRTIMCLHDDAPIKVKTVEMLRGIAEQQNKALEQQQNQQ